MRNGIPDRRPRAGASSWTSSNASATKPRTFAKRVTVASVRDDADRTCGSRRAFSDVVYVDHDNRERPHRALERCAVLAKRDLLVRTLSRTGFDGDRLGHAPAPTSLGACRTARQDEVSMHVARKLPAEDHP